MKFFSFQKKNIKKLEEVFGHFIQLRDKGLKGLNFISIDSYSKELKKLLLIKI